jgi:hypothetical protein
LSLVFTYGFEPEFDEGLLLNIASGFGLGLGYELLLGIADGLELCC